LITHARKDLDPEAAPFARGFGPGEIEGLHEGASLVEVVFSLFQCSHTWFIFVLGCIMKF